MNIWWESWSDFWAMGKHGVYVWGSYGVALLLVLAEVVQARRARQQALLEVRMQRKVTESATGAPSS